MPDTIDFIDFEGCQLIENISCEASVLALRQTVGVLGLFSSNVTDFSECPDNRHPGPSNSPEAFCLSLYAIGAIFGHARAPKPASFNLGQPLLNLNFWRLFASWLNHMLLGNGESAC
jgi:hypothetical protein